MSPMAKCVQTALQQYGVISMCWLCGCADHVGLGNEREEPAPADPNQLNDIMDHERNTSPA